MIDEPSAFAFINKLPLPMIESKKMNANELADWLETGEVEEYDINEAATMLRQQQTEIEALRTENTAFRKELFRIGSIQSCSRAANAHGFVSPAQAGDDAREYIAEILRKAQEK